MCIRDSPKASRPEEVGKSDNPNYCLYHRMLGHPTKSCYIFKDIIQALIDAEVLKLHPEQKKVSQHDVFSLVPKPASNTGRSSSHPERGTKDDQYRQTRITSRRKVSCLSLLLKEGSLGSSQPRGKPTVNYCYQQEVQRQSKSFALQCGVCLFSGSRNRCPLTN